MELKAMHGQSFLIDKEDVELLKGINWYVNKRGYVVGWCTIKKRILRIHRVIMKVEHITKPIIDHKDRNKLNNQKSNLRFCTHSENLKNQSASGRSKYLGVSISDKIIRRKNKLGKIIEYKYLNTIIAQIVIDGKLKYLGKFNTEIEAAKKYNEYAEKYFGEFANLNII